MKNQNEAVASTVPTSSRNTPNTPLKEVMALAETRGDWAGSAQSLTPEVEEAPTFLAELSRDRVLKKK